MSSLTRATYGVSDTEEARYYKRGSFVTGYTIAERQEVLLHSDGFYYQYLGNLPFTVAPASSPDKINWRCVGNGRAYVTVESFGAVPYDGDKPTAGHPSSSAAFQMMFDNFGFIRLKRKKQYKITDPVRLYGYHWEVDGRKGVAYKNTTEKSGITQLMKLGNNYVSLNENAVFITVDNARYWKIHDLDVQCQDAPINDRPNCFYLPSVVNYDFANVNTRGGFNSFWFKSGWQGRFESCRANEEINDSWFYDDSRLNSSGVDVGATDQSATSVVFDKTYSNAAGRYGYHIRNADYISFTNAACDGAGVHAYRFHAVQAEGSVNAESTKGGYIHATGNGGVYDFYSSFYDDKPDNGNFMVTIDAPVSFQITVRGRTRLANRFQVLSGGADVRVNVPRYWKGVSGNIGNNTCVAGSTLIIDIPTSINAKWVWQDGVSQEVRISSPTYSSRFTGLTSFTQKEARIGMPAAANSLSIPMYRIKELFPNFNGTNNNFVEWLEVCVKNGTGIAYGAIVACTNNAIIGSKTDAQTVTGNGYQAAVITSFAADANNLTIHFTGTVGINAIVTLRPI